MECHRAVSLVVLVLLLRWSTLSSAGAPVSRTMTVDSKGGGDFRRIQSAVNFVPDGNREWVRIHVRSGSYRENVTIPREKGFILLEGDGSGNTDISFDNYAHGSIDGLMRRGSSVVTDAMGAYDTATLRVYADDFVARDITFRNTHNAVDKSNMTQALAALVDADRIAFYRCAFHGFQDTLFDNTGRHYFRECFIEGWVDFIFGYARSIYDGCTVVSNMPLYGQQPRWVTAHARLRPGDPGGFVFKDGEVRGTGSQYLGRAWNQYATVVYYHVNMSSIVVPQGWFAWNHGNETSDIFFAEVGCTGPGSDMARRVPWEKHLSDTEMNLGQ